MPPSARVMGILSAVTFFLGGAMPLAADDAELLACAAPVPHRLVIEKRYRADATGRPSGVYWTLALSDRPNGATDAARGVCPETVDVAVLANEIDRGELLLLDLDCDGVVQPADLDLLATALAGPNVPTGGGALCKPTDHDADSDTDLADFAVLQQTGGPGVPTRLDYHVDAGPWTPLFDDANVVPGDPADTFSWAGGTSTLTFQARVAFPGFDSGWHASSVASDDPDRVIVLANGSNYNDIAIQKGVQNPYGSQQSVAEILGPQIMDPNTGIITLPDTDIIMLFELGTLNQQSPAFDMQDLVVKLTTRCAVGQEVVLRDSIGTSSASTDGNFSFSSWHNTSSGTNVKVTMEFVAPQDLTLSTVRVIASKTTQPLDFSGIDYAIRVWSNVDAALANPLNGDIANVLFDVPTSGPNVWGVTGDMPLIGSVTSYEFNFDISSANINFQSGNSGLIGIHFKTNGCSSGAGCLGVLETNDLGSSDRQMSPTMQDGWVWIANSQYSLHDGREAWDVRAASD